MILIFDPHGGIRGGVLADRKGDAFPLDDDNLNLPGRILRVNLCINTVSFGRP